MQQGFIAQKNFPLSFQLAAVNSGLINSKCTNLVPNSELCLGNTGEDCQTTYVVKSGDTCGAIASGAGTNSTILFLNNPQIDEKCENIYVGEVRSSIIRCLRAY